MKRQAPPAKKSRNCANPGHVCLPASLSDILRLRAEGRRCRAWKILRLRNTPLLARASGGAPALGKRGGHSTSGLGCQLRLWALLQGCNSMNNLNDPPNWNIRPNPRADGGDGSKWNYALLVPMLGLAAFRWIWSRESQKEIEKARKVYHQRTAAFQQDLEAKYHAVISEHRRAVAQLSLELEKEQNRTTSFREALISQGRKLAEEKKLLEQERAQIMQEKSQLQPLRSVYLSCLEEEDDWQRRARLMLKEVGEALEERQNIYCSLILPRSARLELEKSLLVRTSVDPVAADLEMAAGLSDIFKHDKHCGDVWNTNKRQNGRLMWMYLKYWELLVELKKFKKVEKVILEK